MPLNVIDHPAAPRCGGHQWFVKDLEALARLTALVMVGRARQVGDIINGAELGPIVASEALKARLRRDLVLDARADAWHRDGLLFETICWIVARMRAGPAEVLSDPHRRATQQGADAVKVAFDSVQRTLVDVTIYEQKCSDNARSKFRDEVLPAFKDWIAGVRDDELTQVAIGLLDRFGLTDVESRRAIGRIVLERPLAFRAAMTVSPQNYSAVECVRLFDGYETLGLAMASRSGDTFPLENIRGWFAMFGAMVWANIERFDV